MKKAIKVVVGFFVIVAVALVAGWPWLKMELASSAHYTEQDRREYNYYTPELLKKMPRISDDYEFSYTNISGPQAFVYGVEFKGTMDIQKIRDYLSAQGYEQQPQKQCSTEAECWRSPRNKDVVSLYALPSLNKVGVEIERSDFMVD